LDRTIRLCVGTWEGEAGSLSAGILKGIALLVVAYGDTLRDDLFKEKVGAFSSREIARTAKDRKAGMFGFAEAILIAYNRKSKKGLSWAKLYSGKRGMMRDSVDFEEEAEEEYQQEVLNY